jgi:hypothetical protein
MSIKKADIVAAGIVLLCFRQAPSFVIPAKAGTQDLNKQLPLRDLICTGWVPAFAGMTCDFNGTTFECTAIYPLALRP